MSLEYYRIEAYYIDKIDGDFLGAYVFEGETRNFLLSDSGGKTLIQNVKLFVREPPEIFIDRLIQEGVLE